MGLEVGAGDERLWTLSEGSLREACYSWLVTARRGRKDHGYDERGNCVHHVLEKSDF